MIVNVVCDAPIGERTEDVFPHQMLKYCEAHGHALITTKQLLYLYIDTRQNPECKDDRGNEMLSCVGKYDSYQDVQEYLDSSMRLKQQPWGFYCSLVALPAEWCTKFYQKVGETTELANVQTQNRKRVVDYTKACSQHQVSPCEPKRQPKGCPFLSLAETD